MSRKALALVLVISLLCLPVLTSAQGIPVYDNANWLTNLLSAIQSVLMVGNQILELTPLDELVAVDGFMDSLQEARELFRDLRGLSWDLKSLDSQFERLFGLEGLPETSGGLEEWQMETRGVIRDARHSAARVQTLISTLQRTFTHLLGLMNSVANMLGNLQISQTISQAQQKIAQLLSEQQLVRTVHERAETIQAVSDVAETDILHKINKNIWRSWPGMGN